MSLPLMMRAALGDEPNVATEYKFGFAPGIVATAVPCSDLLGDQAWQSAAAVVKVSSSSAQDAAGGSGALTCTLYGLDGSYEPLSETVTLTGQTNTTTTGLFLRVFRMICNGPANNAGVIYAGTGTVTAGAPATKYAAISVGANQTLMATYTIGARRTGLIHSLNVSTDGTKNVIAEVRTRAVASGVWRVRDKFTLVKAHGTQEFGAPIVVDATDDVAVWVTGESVASDVSAALSMTIHGS